MSDLLLLAEAFVLGLLAGELVGLAAFVIPLHLQILWAREAEGQPQLELPGFLVPLRMLLALFRPNICTRCGRASKALRWNMLLQGMLPSAGCDNCAIKADGAMAVLQALVLALTVVVVTKGGFATATLFLLLQAWIWLAIGFISLTSRLIPDLLTLPLVWIGLAAGMADLVVTLEDAVQGVVIGYLMPWSIHHLVRRTHRRELFGYGTFKACAALGALVGPEGVCVAFAAASVLKVAESLLVLKRLVGPSGMLPMGHLLALVVVIIVVTKTIQ